METPISDGVGSFGRRARSRAELISARVRWLEAAAALMSREWVACWELRKLTPVGAMRFACARQQCRELDRSWRHVDERCSLADIPGGGVAAIGWRSAEETTRE